MKSWFAALLLGCAIFSNTEYSFAQDLSKDPKGMPKKKTVRKIVVPAEKNGQRSVTSQQVTPSGTIMTTNVPPPKKVVIVPAPPPGGTIPVPQKR